MTTNLTLGSVGLEVKKAQFYLNSVLKIRNIPLLSEDGVFGQKTMLAVGIFQYIHNFNVDGILDSATWDSLIQVFKAQRIPTYETSLSTRVLAIGNISFGTRKTQAYLNNLLNPSPRLIEDGKFGNQTKNAVERYQALNNLKIDGVIGNKTWDCLIQSI